MSGTNAIVEIDIGIDITYNHQFVENEEVQNLNRGKEAVYALSQKNLIEDGLVASVYLGDEHVGVVGDTDNNGYQIVDPSGKIESVRINRSTGKLFITWKEPINKGQSRVVVSYEYRTKD